jgi:hypothetical protein
MGVKAVQITGGGEPTAHPRHADIFRAVLDRGLDLALVTNGVLLRDETFGSCCPREVGPGVHRRRQRETYAAHAAVPPAQFNRAWTTSTTVRGARRGGPTWSASASW